MKQPAANNTSHLNRAVQPSTTISFFQRLSERSVNTSPHQKPLIFCVFLVFLPHTFFQSVGVLVYCSMILVWQLAVLYERIRPPMHITHIILALVAIAIIFPEPGVSLSQNTGTELLLIMMCLKLSEARSQRDVAVMIGLCLFTLVTIFISSNSILALIWSLLVIHCLFCLLAATVTNSRPDYINRRQVKLLLKSFFLALLLFAILPHPDGPLWNIANPGFAASTGLADSVAPGNINQLQDNDEVAFRVHFKSKAPATTQMYWRGPVFTFYDGQRWSEPEFIAKQNIFNRPISPEHANSENVRLAQASTDHYEVTMAPHHRNWLFTLDPDTPAPKDTHYSSIGELLSKQKITNTHNYEIKPGTQAIHTFQTEPFSARYLHLPNLYSWRARKLAESFSLQLNPDLPRDAQIVERAIQHFHDEDFLYTRKAPKVKYDPIDEFLFKHRRGYCEHFASAFAFIMRAAGIPSRIVTGYYGAEYNADDDYYVVRKSNAHAWTEIWIKNRGWVTIDPVNNIPLQQDTGTNTSSLTTTLIPGIDWVTDRYSKLKLYIDSINYRWEKHITGSDNRIQDILPGPVSIAGLFFIIALAVLVKTGNRFRINKTQRMQPAVKSYKLFCKKMEKAGFSRAENESPNDFAQRITQDQTDMAGSVTRITSLYNLLRYSQSPPPDACKELKKITRSLKIQ